jgi:hypothetical protein
MTKFLIERRFQVSEDQMPEIGRRSRQIATDQFPEIIWEHSHVVVDDAGTVKTFCVYEAPSEEIVRRHARELGAHEIEGVYIIAGDVTPEDFPLN